MRLDSAAKRSVSLPRRLCTCLQTVPGSEISALISARRLRSQRRTSWSFGRPAQRKRAARTRAPSIGYKHALNNAATSRAEIIGPGNGSLPPSQRTVQKWFNTAAFTAPPPLEWGDAARNSLQGPATKELDVSLFKNFRFHALPSRRCGRATSPVPVQSTGGQQRAAVG